MDSLSLETLYSLPQLRTLTVQYLGEQKIATCDLFTESERWRSLSDTVGILGGLFGQTGTEGPVTVTLSQTEAAVVGSVLVKVQKMLSKKVKSPAKTAKSAPMPMEVTPEKVVVTIEAEPQVKPAVVVQKPVVRQGPVIVNKMRERKQRNKVEEYHALVEKSESWADCVPECSNAQAPPAPKGKTAKPVYPRALYPCDLPVMGENQDVLESPEFYSHFKTPRQNEGMNITDFVSCRTGEIHSIATCVMCDSIRNKLHYYRPSNSRSDWVPVLNQRQRKALVAAHAYPHSGELTYSRYARSITWLDGGPVTISTILASKAEGDVTALSLARKTFDQMQYREDGVTPGLPDSVLELKRHTRGRKLNRD